MCYSKENICKQKLHHFKSQVLTVLLSIPFINYLGLNIEILVHKLRKLRKSLLPHQTPQKFPSFARKICLPKNKRNEWNISKRDPYVEKTTKNVWHWSFLGLWLLHNLDTVYQIELKEIGPFYLRSSLFSPSNLFMHPKQKWLSQKSLAGIIKNFFV